MPNILRFGRVEIRLHERLVFVDHEPVKLGGRALDLLLVLVENRDRVMTKNELMALVWPGLVVEEGNLQVQTSAIRKLLGPHAVSTVPGRGYKFTLARTGDESEEVGSLHAAGPDHTALVPKTTNLPESVAAIYGRRSDEAQVAALLQQHRVLSIVGAGGIGKTRLALAVAARWRHDYADGAWWVDLSKLAQGDRVAGEVARVLGVALSSSRSAVDVVAEALRPLSLLLVLDNCEHLLEAAATVVDAISAAAPRVALLSTSQEPLRTSEEHAYRLDALSLPTGMSVAQVADSGAAQLFVSRARAVDPRFELTASNAQTVAEICKRLDGMPLALELAAARIPLLGLDGLRSRLDERFDVLTGGSRFVLRRHQTLRAALDFSHGLLTEQEQAVFRKLGVFAGGFSVENAQEIAVEEGFESWTSLDCLGTLVDKSIVMAEGGTKVRLRLLETTRAYALEKLADAGETKALLARHLRIIMNTFAKAFDDFWGSADAAWLARYEPELDNLRAALTFAMANHPQAAIVLMGNSRPLWLLLALQPEALASCEAAVAYIAAETPAKAAGRLWLSVAAMAANAWPKRSLEAGSVATQLLREAGDREPLMAALHAVASGGSGPKTEAQLGALEELRRLDDPSWPGRLRAILPMACARVHRGAGQYAEALRDYESAAEISAACGNDGWELSAHSNIGEVAMTMGDLDRAVVVLRNTALSLSFSRDQLFFAFTTAAVATALLFQGDVAGARNALRPAVPLIARFDIGARYAYTAALLAALEGRWQAAGQLFGYGQAENERHGMDAESLDQTQARERAARLLAENARESDLELWRERGRTLPAERAFDLALSVAA